MADSKVLEKHKAEANSAGLTLLGPGAKRDSRIYRFNNCKHVQEIQVTQVRNSTVKCAQCFKEKLNSEAASAGLSLVSLA